MKTRSAQRAANLWADVPATPEAFDPSDQPEYLRRTIEPGTPLATAVQLAMHGEIRLGRWRCFRAREVLHLSRGFLWEARVGIISGFDALLDGAGLQRWTVLGLLPVMKASGANVTRSSLGRWMLESIWLPSMLLPSRGATWKGSTVRLARILEADTLSLTTDDAGRLREIRMARWGNPDGLPFGYYPFGGVVLENRTFAGYTIPSELHVGWHFGTERWDEGESFRVGIENAVFR